MKYYNNYVFDLKTEIVFGRDQENEVGRLVKKYGGTKVLLVYGGGSIKRSGLYDRVVASLENEGLEVVPFGGAEPNPRRSHTEEGMELARREGCDFFLGVGSGSALDTAKTIAFAIDWPGEDYYTDIFIKHIPCNEHNRPCGCVLTHASSGTESSTSVLQLDDVVRNDKFGGGSCLQARFDFAILNPELTFTTSAYQTAAGVIDMLAHTLERYFYIRSDSALGDGFAVAQMRDVLKYGPIAVEDPTNYEARAELMLCACFGHNDITNIGKSGCRDFSYRGGPHYLEGCLSGHFRGTHGAGLGVIMPAWLEYVANYDDPECVRRAAQFAVEVFGVRADYDDPRTVALQGVRLMREWIAGMNMPLTITDLLGRKLTEEDVEILCNHPAYQPNGKHEAFVGFTREQLADFYRKLIV